MKEVSESVDQELTSTVNYMSPNGPGTRRENAGHRLYERGIKKNELKEMFIREMRAIKQE
jgi:hypothetical protein